LKETRIITKNWDRVNPQLIESYRDNGGYESFLRLIREKTSPEKVVSIIEKSGLRGRGGGGFLTGKKWRLAMDASKRKKQRPRLLINGDESEPGTYKDRLIIEKNPHAVIEGTLIAAYALGAEDVVIYINGRYRGEANLMKNCLVAAEKNKLVGQNIGASSFTVQIQVVQSPGGYICGEESALINTLEGRRAEPRTRPPYPTEEGLEGEPTVVNNIETIANIPAIFEMGADAYSKIGHKENTGTKMYLVEGAVRHPGAYELPLGVTLKELVFKIAGGLKVGRRLEFIQVGGASGAFVFTDGLKKRLTYSGGADEIKVGSGAILVVDDTVDLVDLIFSWAQFYRHESCGQCTPCREGTYQLFKIAERLRGEGILPRDIENIEDLLAVLRKTSLCPLGSMASCHWQNILSHYGKQFFINRIRKAK